MTQLFLSHHPRALQATASFIFVIDDKRKRKGYDDEMTIKNDGTVYCNKKHHAHSHMGEYCLLRCKGGENVYAVCICESSLAHRACIFFDMVALAFMQMTRHVKIIGLHFIVVCTAFKKKPYYIHV